MKQKLNRVLRVRTILEDVSRLDYERKNADLSHLKHAAAEQRQLERITRADVLRMLAEGESSAESWLLKIADAEMMGWKEARIEALAESRAAEVGEAREELQARRIEKRQLEALLSATARAEQREQARREQNRTDDWFQSRSPGSDRKRD
jgi:hypothetical protein